MESTAINQLLHQDEELEDSGSMPFDKLREECGVVAGGERVSVGAERDGIGAGLAVLQTEQLLSGDRVPQPDRPVIAGGRQGRAIG